MTKLRPCPFCGGTARMHHEQRRGNDGSIVKCEVCCAQAEWKMVSYISSSDEEAAKLWNRRYEVDE